MNFLLVPIEKYGSDVIIYINSADMVDQVRIEGIIMLAAVKGYYDGNQIVVNEVDRKNFCAGDEVIITILDKISRKKVHSTWNGRS